MREYSFSRHESEGSDRSDTLADLALASAPWLFANGRHLVFKASPFVSCRLFSHPLSS